MCSRGLVGVVFTVTLRPILDPARALDGGSCRLFVATSMVMGLVHHFERLLLLDLAALPSHVILDSPLASFRLQHINRLAHHLFHVSSISEIQI